MPIRYSAVVVVVAVVAISIAAVFVTTDVEQFVETGRTTKAASS